MSPDRATRGMRARDSPSDINGSASKPSDQKPLLSHSVQRGHGLGVIDDGYPGSLRPLQDKDAGRRKQSGNAKIEVGHKHRSSDPRESDDHQSNAVEGHEDRATECDGSQKNATPVSGVTPADVESMLADGTWNYCPGPASPKL